MFRKFTVVLALLAVVMCAPAEQVDVTESKLSTVSDHVRAADDMMAFGASTTTRALIESFLALDDFTAEDLVQFGEKLPPIEQDALIERAAKSGRLKTARDHIIAIDNVSILGFTSYNALIDSFVSLEEISSDDTEEFGSRMPGDYRNKLIRRLAGSSPLTQ